ncbi:MAG: hypothetical protein E2O54_08010 [Gammaproteobacteria bacterium]|nr:MAG: hypothetical protein E2O54_08010 [Gammaproteobacteria bacterium]
MGRLLTTTLSIALVGGFTATAQADTRVKAMGEFGLTTAGRYESYLDGGMGKLRFGSDDEGMQLFGGFLQVENDFGALWNSVISIDINDQLENPVGFTEALLRYRPLPIRGMRFRGKLGLFRPPISFEHSADGWATRYTIQASALNSWVGEELGAYGFEASVSNDRASGSELDWGLKAAVFYGNDPVGTMLAWRGWSPNNVQTRPGDKIPFADPVDIVPVQWSQAEPNLRIDKRLFGYPTGSGDKIPFSDHSGPGQPDPGPDPGQPDPGQPDPGQYDITSVRPSQAEPYLEIDNRPGYYIAADLGVPQRVRLRLMHYDNRADPEISKHGQYAWRTVFNSVGFQTELPFGVGLIGQYMWGRSYMGPKSGNERAVDIDFDAKFVLLTKVLGENRFSVRREWFAVDDNDGRDFDPNGESLRGWTLSYQRQVTPNWRVAFEWLEVEGTRDARELVGLQRNGTEDALYATLRWSR